VYILAAGKDDDVTGTRSRPWSLKHRGWHPAYSRYNSLLWFLSRIARLSRVAYSYCFLPLYGKQNNVVIFIISLFLFSCCHLLCRTSRTCSSQSPSLHLGRHCGTPVADTTRSPTDKPENSGSSIFHGRTESVQNQLPTELKRTQSTFCLSPRTENVSFQPCILLWITRYNDYVMRPRLTVGVYAIEKLMPMLMLIKICVY